MGRNKRESTELTKLFAERLEDLIQEAKALGKSQKEISDEIGVSSGILSEWASDKKTPGIDGLYKISKYFGVSTDYLLGLRDERTPDCTVQAICDYTHLTEQAVISLHRPPVYADPDTKLTARLFSLVSDFLCDFDFWRLISSCDFFLKSTQKAASCETSIELGSFGVTKEGTTRITGVAAYEYQLMHTAELFKTFLDSKSALQNLKNTAKQNYEKRLELIAKAVQEYTNDE